MSYSRENIDVHGAPKSRVMYCSGFLHATLSKQQVSE